MVDHDVVDERGRASAWPDGPQGLHDISRDGRLDADRRYEFEERAGIIEVENEQPRDIAECLALIDLLRSYPGALIGVTAYEVERDGTTEFVLTTDVASFAATDVGVVRVADLMQVIASNFGGIATLARFD